MSNELNLLLNTDDEHNLIASLKNIKKVSSGWQTFNRRL